MTVGVSGSMPTQITNSERKAAKHRLPELRCQGVATVPAGPAVGQHLPGHLGQAEGIIEFTEGEQPGVGRDLGTVEFQLQAAVESDPKISMARQSG